MPNLQMGPPISYQNALPAFPQPNHAVLESKKGLFGVFGRHREPQPDPHFYSRHRKPPNVHNLDSIELDFGPPPIMGPPQRPLRFNHKPPIQKPSFDFDEDFPTFPIAPTATTKPKHRPLPTESSFTIDSNFPDEYQPEPVRMKKKPMKAKYQKPFPGKQPFQIVMDVYPADPAAAAHGHHYSSGRFHDFENRGENRHQLILHMNFFSRPPRNRADTPSSSTLLEAIYHAVASDNDRLDDEHKVKFKPVLYNSGPKSSRFDYKTAEMADFGDLNVDESGYGMQLKPAKTKKPVSTTSTGATNDFISDDYQIISTTKKYKTINRGSSKNYSKTYGNTLSNNQYLRPSSQLQQQPAGFHPGVKHSVLPSWNDLHSKFKPRRPAAAIQLQQYQPQYKQPQALPSQHSYDYLPAPPPYRPVKQFGPPPILPQKPPKQSKPIPYISYPFAPPPRPQQQLQMQQMQQNYYQSGGYGGYQNQQVIGSGKMTSSGKAKKSKKKTTTTLADDVTVTSELPSVWGEDFFKSK